MVEHDVAIVGAGPVGIELAVALKRARLDFVQFDAGQVGHTIGWFAPQTRFFSSNQRIAIAGVPLQTPDGGKSTREQYLTYLRTIVQMFDLSIRTYEPVVAIQRGENGFVLTTRARAGPRQYRARRIVLATGGTDRPRRLNVPGEDLPHVSHYFQDPHTYFRTRLLVVGGRNSAVEAALRCYQAGAELSLSYRRAELDPHEVKYWLLPEINALVSSGRIAGHFSTVVRRITPTHVTLEAPDGRTSELPADFVLLMIGYEADMALCRAAGVELSEPGRKPVHDPRTMQTNVPGVYVAGTVVAGTQAHYRLFIENCHVHVERIVAALSGRAAGELVEPAPADVLDRPES